MTTAPPDHLAPATLGVLVHEAITDVCLSGLLPAPGHETMVVALDAARRVMIGRQVRTPRERSLFQSVATATSVYLHRFRPGGVWATVGANVPLSASRPDLVFEHRESGAVIVDEFKTGAPERDHESSLGREQCLRHVRGGAEKWGDRFVGARLLWLAAPNHSRLYTPDGRHALLCETGWARLRA